MRTQDINNLKDKSASLRKEMKPRQRRQLPQTRRAALVASLLLTGPQDTGWHGLTPHTGRAG